MTVGELRKILEQFPSGQEVLVSNDPEGNAVRPVDYHSRQIYCFRSGDVFDLDELDDVGEQPWQKVLILYPG